MKKFILSLMLLAGLGVATQAQTQGSCCSKDAKKGSCCGVSNITPEQQKQMDALKANHQKEMLELKNQLKEKEAHYVTVTTGNSINEKDAEKTLEEISTIRLTMAKKKLAHQMAVRKILTDEQKIEFDKHQAKMASGEGCMGGQHDGKCNHDGKTGDAGCKGHGDGKMQGNTTGQGCEKGNGTHGQGAGCCSGKTGSTK